jgi:hypothetical protein
MKITNEESLDRKAAPDFSDWEWGDWDLLGKRVSARAATVLWEQMQTDIEEAAPDYPRFTLTDTGKPAIVVWLLDSHTLVMRLDEIVMPGGEDASELDEDDRKKFIAIFRGWIDTLEG